MVGDIFQPTHLLFVLVVALLVLGPKRLPEVGRTLGSGIRDFRAAINGETPEKREEREELRSEPWHPDPDPDPDPEPEGKHEFAHDGEPTPENQHEFARGEPEVPVAAVGAASAPTSPASVQAPASTPASPAAMGSDATANEHEFAHESSQPADHSAGTQD